MPPTSYFMCLGRFKGLTQVMPTDQKFITSVRELQSDRLICGKSGPLRNVKKEILILIMPIESKRKQKALVLWVRTNSPFWNRTVTRYSGRFVAVWKSGSWGKEGDGRLGWGGYVALLHQHVCSNVIAGLRHTKKTRLLKHSQIWSPGGWTQLCSNYHTKPDLNPVPTTEVRGECWQSPPAVFTEKIQLHSRCVWTGSLPHVFRELGLGCIKDWRYFHTGQVKTLTLPL